MAELVVLLISLVALTTACFSLGVAHGSRAHADPKKAVLRQRNLGEIVWASEPKHEAANVIKGYEQRAAELGVVPPTTPAGEEVAHGPASYASKASGPARPEGRESAFGTPANPHPSSLVRERGLGDVPAMRKYRKHPFRK